MASCDGGEGLECGGAGGGGDDFIWNKVSGELTPLSCSRVVVVVVGGDGGS